MYLILNACQIQKKEKCRGQWRIKIKEESKEREKRNRESVDTKEREESERSIEGGR